MAKGALEGERTMTKMVPAISTIRVSVAWTPLNGWVSSTNNDMLMYESYIDTSGYATDDLTVFPLGVTLQDPGRYLCSNNTVAVQVLDIISQERLDLDEVATWVAANNMPGMPATDVDFTQIMWGQYRTMLGQASFQAAGTEYLAASVGLFGSGSPSTAQKLYCYRFIVLAGSQEGDTLEIPASRFILQAVVAGEAELEFLMRQKRSYELAT